MACDNELYTSPLPNNPTIPKKYSAQRSQTPIGFKLHALYAIIHWKSNIVSDYNKDDYECAISKLVEACMNAHGRNLIFRLSRSTIWPWTTSHISALVKTTLLHAYRVLSYIVSWILNLKGFKRARIVERRSFNPVSRVLEQHIRHLLSPFDTWPFHNLQMHSADT